MGASTATTGVAGSTASLARAGRASSTLPADVRARAERVLERLRAGIDQHPDVRTGVRLPPRNRSPGRLGLGCRLRRVPGAVVEEPTLGDPVQPSRGFAGDDTGDSRLLEAAAREEPQGRRVAAGGAGLLRNEQARVLATDGRRRVEPVERHGLDRPVDLAVRVGRRGRYPGRRAVPTGSLPRPCGGGRAAPGPRTPASPPPPPRLLPLGEAPRCAPRPSRRSGAEPSRGVLRSRRRWNRPADTTRGHVGCVRRRTSFRSSSSHQSRNSWGVRPSRSVASSVPICFDHRTKCRSRWSPAATVLSATRPRRSARHLPEPWSARAVRVPSGRVARTDSQSAISGPVHIGAGGRLQGALERCERGRMPHASDAPGRVNARVTHGSTDRRSDHISRIEALKDAYTRYPSVG